jgi:hypothetical protein
MLFLEGGLLPSFLNDISCFVSILVYHRLHLQRLFTRRMPECLYRNLVVLLICYILSTFKSRFRFCDETLHLFLLRYVGDISIDICVAKFCFNFIRFLYTSF